MGKDSFVLYAEQEEVIKRLSDEQAGKLYKAIFEYNRTGEIPEMEYILELVFTPIRQQLDRSKENWEKTCQKRSEAGKLGGRPKKANGFLSEEEKAKKANGFFEKHNEPDNEPVNVPDNEPDNNPKEKKEKRKKKEVFAKPTVKEVTEYCSERKNNIDPEQFFDFYESKGWKISRDPMSDWKAAVRNWERRRQADSAETSKQSSSKKLEDLRNAGYDF